MPVAHLNHTEIFYAEVGEGLPCLVMHGGLGTFRGAAAPLPRGVLCKTQRGGADFLHKRTGPVAIR